MVECLHDARFVIELLPDDLTADTLLESLQHALRSECEDLTCAVERKREFVSGETFEGGIELAARNAVTYREPWCVYVAPRCLAIKVRDEELRVNAAIILIARRRRLAALFLHTFVNGDIPEYVEVALSSKLDAMRVGLDLIELDIDDEEALLRFREAIEQAYMSYFRNFRTQ